MSVDNVFVFALLLSYFAVPPVYQHKVLFWGILGALIMRAIMIAAGAVLIAKFAWIIYVFGGFLILTGIKMIVKREDEIHPERNPVVRWFKRLMPVTPDYRGDRFFVREGGLRMATPLFVVLGVDGSAAQVEAARALGVDARVMDAYELAFEREFDAVFSNAVLQWMKRPEMVVAGVWRALRPGCFVAECGGHGCVAKIEGALLEDLDRRGIDGRAVDPWYVRLRFAAEKPGR